ncbi:MAG: alpha-glucosidase, partial [Candidatus Sericytochromatia bacterium]|nr:alpha-glucosidase [Candidatus Tanganyikabacteria bacterium]
MRMLATMEFPLQPGDRCFGLGEKTGFLDRRGRKYTMWNTDDASPHIETLDPMYVAIPWLVHLERDGSALGLFLDDPTGTEWDLGAGDPGKVVVSTPRAAVDLYLVVGPDLGDVVRRYAALTGTMPLPPKWAIGYQQCRYSYMSADRVREVAREF